MKQGVVFFCLIVTVFTQCIADSGVNGVSIVGTVAQNDKQINDAINKLLKEHKQLADFVAWVKNNVFAVEVFSVVVLVLIACLLYAYFGDHQGNVVDTHDDGVPHNVPPTEQSLPSQVPEVQVPQPRSVSLPVAEQLPVEQPITRQPVEAFFLGQNTWGGMVDHGLANAVTQQFEYARRIGLEPSNVQLSAPALTQEPPGNRNIFTRLDDQIAYARRIGLL